MKVDGIVYLSETGSHRVNFANVFADLSKLLLKETAEPLEGLYKNPQTSTGDKMRALLDAFPSGRVILLLDNFETLIDPESLSLRDSELSDALNALLSGQHHAVKAVITTRIAPRDLAISEPGRQHHLSLDEGLESPYAENVLREIDADGLVGLKTAPDALLKVAREKTRGYPRALEALYAILSVDRYTTLEELLEISLPDEVVQKLVGEAFNRLDPSAQKVMQALAVYNRPVSPAAIDYLLQPHLPSIDSALVLNRLVNMHFARREAGRYYLGVFHLSYKVIRQPKVTGYAWSGYLRQTLEEQAENLWLGLQGVAGWMRVGRINGVVVVPCDKHSMRPSLRFQRQRAGAVSFQRLFEASACRRVQSGLSQSDDKRLRLRPTSVDVCRSLPASFGSGVPSKSEVHRRVHLIALSNNRSTRPLPGSLA